jgi:diguanylate cyclase (GGDEF)-like protein
MIFSIYFARSKAFVLLFIPLFYMFYMFNPTFLGLDGGNYSFWYLYPLTLSFGFLIIGILQERGLFCFYGIIKIAIMLTILGITYYLLYTFTTQFKDALNTSILGFDISKLLKVNDFSFLIFILTFIITTTISSIFFSNNIEKAPTWAFIALFIPAIFFQTKESFILFCALSSLLIIIALLKDTYQMSYIDTLTGIPARRALEEAYLKLGSTYSLAMGDIDLFKKFNDTYGHDIGDDVLKLVAQQLNSVKGGGQVFRYGGEEFTILFPNKTAQETIIFLEEVRIKIEKRGFKIRNENRPKEAPKVKSKSTNFKKVNLTISIGVASSPKDGTTPENVLKMADKALYKAKESGRNCTKST